ncbi:PAS domain-containing sensor histidine kinase [Tenacibaculum geojense]|uniref:histidine kinase n=1 Tax=Tenacibaculum geojense TaxID=915352 RepID=A0ABW3JTY5_9FLAO
MTTSYTNKDWIQNGILFFLATLLTCTLFIAHINISKNIPFGALYCMVILYSWLLPWKNTAIYAGIICSILIFTAVLFSYNDYQSTDLVGINTTISLITLWITVSLVTIAKRGFEELEIIKNNLEKTVKRKTIDLKESEQLYKFLYENANEMYASISPENGAILKCNTTLAKKLGYSKKELIGQPVFKIYSDNSEDKIKNLLKLFKSKGYIKNEEVTLQTKTGKTIKAILNVSSVKDENGEIIYSRSSLFDITEIKNLEYKFSALLESAPDAILIVNNKAEIIISNKQAQHLFKYKKEELLGLKTAQLIHKKHRRNIENYFAKPHKNLTHFKQELHGLNKDEIEFPIEITVNPIKTFEGPLIIIAIRDISERKKLQKEQEIFNKVLQNKNKELEQFVFIASHDLQEPLRTVHDFSNLLNEKYAEQLDEEANIYLNFILSANERMKSLITGLLNYGLLGKKEQKITVDCNEIINQVIDDLGSALQNTNAIFQYEKLPNINCYATELRLLFQNLISNALKFRKQNVSPIIKISAEKKQDHWLFCVEDNGIGISEKHKDKIFIIFQRLHNREDFEGIGIGLAHCKKIVALHEGEIWVESKEGKGSAFYFTIPHTNLKVNNIKAIEV